MKICPNRFRLLSLAIAAFLLTGCPDSGSNTPGEGDSASSSDAKKMSIAVIPKSTGGEFWETVESGARQAAEELDVEIKWEGTLTETEIAEQNKIIENMINLDVDGMAVAPLNSKATSRSVAGAVDADIPVVVFDSALDGDKHLSFVATNNVAGGELAGKHMVELLEGGKKKIAVLRYVQGTASTENRAKGFVDSVKEAGHEIVADPFPEDGTVAGCKKTASNTLEGFVDDGKLAIDGIFACNLTSALGMLAAIEDLRKSGVEVTARFIGFDSSPKLVDGLQASKIDALVSQDPKKMGYLAVETIVKHLQGEEIEKMVDTGVELVTAKRLENEDAIRELVGLKPKK
ncbi:MAG: substrate-binding domain-containing protein [Planctomycetota bacterium]